MAKAPADAASPAPTGIMPTAHGTASAKMPKAHGSASTPSPTPNSVSAQKPWIPTTPTTAGPIPTREPTKSLAPAHRAYSRDKPNCLVKTPKIASEPLSQMTARIPRPKRWTLQRPDFATLNASHNPRQFVCLNRLPKASALIIPVPGNTFRVAFPLRGRLRLAARPRPVVGKRWRVVAVPRRAGSGRPLPADGG